MESNQCIFKDYLHLCEPQKEYFHLPLSSSEVKISKIKECSHKRKDGLHKVIDEKSGSMYHKSCYAMYTSNSHIERLIKKRKLEESNQVPTSAKRRSTTETFEFKKQCLICGKDCKIEPDPKHPDRWKEAYLARTADRGKGFKSVRQVLLEKCNQRADTWGDEVRIRIEAGFGDLHAMDARYHASCYKSFTADRNIKFAAADSSTRDNSKDAINSVFKLLKDEPARIWNSIELHDIYTQNGGKDFTVHRFMSAISERISKTHHMLKSVGCATLVVPNDIVSKYFKMVKIEEEPIDIAVRAVAKKIKSEIATTCTRPKMYTDISLYAECSSTLLFLLSELDSKFEEHKSAGLIGSMVTTVVKGGFTMLQLGLGVLVNSKTIIQHLHEYGITPTYDEIRRFKISAANHSDNSSHENSENLIQIVSDNFDADIATPNGLKQTHALASIVCTAKSNEASSIECPRLSTADLSRISLRDESFYIYHGAKKQPLPSSLILRSAYSLAFLCRQVLGQEECNKSSFSFMKCSLEDKKNTPDFNGFHYRKIRSEMSIGNLKPSKKHPVNEKSIVTYLPLIDKTPSDPSTMLTMMIRAEEESKSRGQNFTIFTTDQQLYAVNLNIIWSNPSRWVSFIPRIGGMHWAMSFIGCIGTLMEGSGLKELMKTAFSGVEKMLIGKKFPSNVRALRFVLLEILEGNMDNLSSYQDFQKFMNEMISKSSLACVWMKNFVEPLLLLFTYIQAEREANFPLHIVACWKMLPYFFAANHFNYARYGLYYLISMERLPNEVMSQFLKGEHVAYNSKGIWNGIWSDMLIETTYMKYGKGPRGIIGITTNERALSIWSKSHHIATSYLEQLDNLRSKTQSKSMKHKHEGPARMALDQKDRSNIQSALSTCVHPFKDSDAPLCNIFTGEIANESSNVHKAVDIGMKQMETFKSNLPQSFHEKISSKVVKLTPKKGKKQDIGEQSLSTEIIFTRVLFLLNQGIEMQNIFNFELSPVPASMFKDQHTANYPSSKKAVLLNYLKIESSCRSQLFDTVIIDGGALFYNVHWPLHGKISDLAHTIFLYVKKRMERCNVYVAFDRYKEFSIKSDTRKARVSSLRREHLISLNTPLPPRETLLGCSKNKEKLIDIVSKYVACEAKDLQYNTYLVLDSESAIEICNGSVFENQSLTNNHEEADVKIPLHVHDAVKRGALSIEVNSEDTDVFCLLLQYHHMCKWNSIILMVSKHWCIDICKSSENSKNLLDNDLLNLHALSGCDSVPMLHGIGKKKAIDAYKQHPVPSLHLLDNEDLAIQESKEFIGACYSTKKVICTDNSSENRERLWKAKAKAGNQPSLKSLPPTNEALRLNILRARFQSIIWHSSLENRAPSFNPCDFGWDCDNELKTLSPKRLPTNIPIAPEEVMRSIKCACLASKCKTNSCGCRKINIKCSEFCECEDCSNYEIVEFAESDDCASGESESE